MNALIRGLSVFSLTSIALLGCMGSSSESNSGNNDETPNNIPPTNTSDNSNRYQPNISDTWHWQLTGELNTSYEVNVYDIDLFDTSTETIQAIKSGGSNVICYFSAGSWEDWREDANQFPESVIGESLANWEGERWLDIRSEQVRAQHIKRLDIAKDKGCDAVEPDNVDGYLHNTGFNLTQEDLLDFNRFLSTEAHRRGLAIGLKNGLSLTSELVDHFDFAVNEQCFHFSECHYLQPFIDAGKAVFNAEYHSQYIEDSTARQQLCQESINLQFSTLIMNIELNDSIRFSCL